VTYYYTLNPDGSIASSANYKFSEDCLETGREIKYIGGKGYFADEEIAEPAVATEAPLEYDNESGGGGVSEPLGERMARIEAGFEAMRSDIATMRAEGKTSLRWTIGTILFVAGVILTAFWHTTDKQETHFQALIDAHQKISEARMDEFRRDSARNYDLALKALERSMVQPQPPQAPAPQAPPSE